MDAESGSDESDYLVQVIDETVELSDGFVVRQQPEMFFVIHQSRK